MITTHSRDTFDSIKWLAHDEADITIRHQGYFFFWKVGLPRMIEYRGVCTVWHQLPRYTRVGTPMEGMLSEFWTREYYKKYPPDVL